jgi:hypothetical protein
MVKKRWSTMGCPHKLFEKQLSRIQIKEFCQVMQACVANLSSLVSLKLPKTWKML